MNTERVRILVESGDHMVVRDVRSDSSARTFARSIIIRVQEGAHLSYRDLQQLPESAAELTMMTVLMEANSSFLYEGLQCGARYAQTVINIVIQGEGAEATINAGSIATGNQRHLFSTTQHHKVPRARTRCAVRSAVYEHAAAQYYGSIRIDEGAHHTEAFQEHKSLLLSDDARAWARPSLSIENHDVQCGHGSAVGQLDEEALFYLQCRGMVARRAQQILESSFFEKLFRVDLLKNAVGKGIFDAQEVE